MCEYTLAVGSGQCRIGVGVGVGVGVGGCAVLGVRPERGTGMVKGRRGQGDGGRWGGVVGRYVYEAADNSTGPNPRLQESICGAREGVEDGDERLYSICTLLGWV